MEHITRLLFPSLGKIGLEVGGRGGVWQSIFSQLGVPGCLLYPQSNAWVLAIPPKQWVSWIGVGSTRVPRRDRFPGSGRVPRASRAWFPAPKSKVKSCFWHSHLSKNCLWRSELTRNAKSKSPNVQVSKSPKVQKSQSQKVDKSQSRKVQSQK